MTAVLLLSGGALRAGEQPVRTVTIKLAPDRGLGNLLEWKIATARVFDDCARRFEGWFGVRLAIARTEPWFPSKSRGNLVGALEELKAGIPPGSCDIVLGVVSPDRIEDAHLGVASYPFGYAVVQDTASREALTYAILHEMCHLFGAIDLRERGSIMDIEAPGLEVDAFTAQVVALHADRVFGIPSVPVSQANLERTEALFEDRARLDRNEPEVHLLLAILHIQKNDFETAARDCADAIREGGGSPGLNILLGNISLKQGDPETALEQYRRALAQQPAEAGLHFNIGLAYVQEGRLEEASAEFERALKIEPHCEEARRALKEVRQARNLNALAALRLSPLVIDNRTEK